MFNFDVCISSGLKYVHAGVIFRHFSSASPQHRVAVLKFPKQRTGRDTALGSLAVIANRRNLPDHRKFTESQKILIQDYNSGIHCLDRTSAFSLRPPELLCFNDLELYSTFFSSVFHRKVPVPLTQSISEVSFFDGGGRCIKVHIDEVIVECMC